MVTVPQFNSGDHASDISGNSYQINSANKKPSNGDNNGDRWYTRKHAHVFITLTQFRLTFPSLFTHFHELNHTQSHIYKLFHTLSYTVTHVDTL